MTQPKLEDHIGLIKWHAQRHAQQARRLDLLDDYIQAAAEGFLRALKSKPYDPTLGTVGTYAGPWMRNAMQNDVDSKASMPIALPQKLLIREPDTVLPKLHYADSPISQEDDVVDQWSVLEGLPTYDPTEDIDEGMHAEDLLDRIYSSVPREYHVMVELIVESEGNIGPLEISERLGISKSTAHWQLTLARNLMRAACGAAPVLDSVVQRKSWYAHVRKQIRRHLGMVNNRQQFDKQQRADYNRLCKWAGIPTKGERR